MIDRHNQKHTQDDYIQERYAASFYMSDVMIKNHLIFLIDNELTLLCYDLIVRNGCCPA